MSLIMAEMPGPTGSSAGQSCDGTGLGLRGGGGVVFGNTVFAKMGVTFVLESKSHGPYPVRDQVHNVWIWENTFTGLRPGEQDGVLVTSWGGTEDLDPKEYIQQDRDYSLRKPAEELDGFDYKPYGPKK